MILVIWEEVVLIMW